MLDEAPEVPECHEPSERRRVRPRLRSAQEVRDKRRRLLIWALSVFVCVLFVNAIVGENGYLATLRSRQEESTLWSAVARLRIQNQQLQQESARLRTDPRALEETARRELGLLRSGETLLIIRDVVPAAPSPSASPAQE